MPRNSGGNYSLPTGNPVVTNSVISSSWANSTLNDLATAMTDSLSRSGDGGMLAPLLLDAGTIGAPGLSWSAESTSGLYRAAAGDFRWVIGGVDILEITDSILESSIQIKSTKVWASSNLINYGLLVDSAYPAIALRETDATTNNGVWDIAAVGEALVFRAVADGIVSTNAWLTVDRTGTAIDSVAFAATEMSLTANANTTSAQLLLDNDSNGTSNASRLSVTSGDANAALFVAGSGRTSTILTGGPTGAQAVLRTLGAYPIVFGTNNTAWLSLLSDGVLRYEGSNFTISNNSAAFNMVDANAAANVGRVRFSIGSGSFAMQAVSDDGGTSNAIMSVVTAGTASPSSIDFPNGTLLYGGREVGYKNLIVNSFSGNATLGSNSGGLCYLYTGSGGHTLTLGEDFPSQGLVTVVNAGSGNVSLAETLSGTLNWLNGSGSISTGTRTLVVGGVASFWRTSNTAYVWGTGLS